jgi:nitrate/nitrite transporter NarK
VDPRPINATVRREEEPALDQLDRASRAARIAEMAALIFAGEAIFGLPFHVARFFRPTMLEVFELSNTQLGAMFSAYGVLAMLAYFPGGAIADRFSARKLLTASMLLTALGGLYMLAIPDARGLTLLFGFFGLTTIFLFWGALIRATRGWGGARAQGRAFGVLDGGRGLLAAVLASAATLLLRWFFPDDAALVSDEQRRRALQSVIAVYTCVTLAGGVLTWCFVPEHEIDGTPAAPAPGRRDVARLLRMPSIWLQALIVVCAYCAYKGADDYTLLAVQGYGMNEVQGASVGALGAWVRPFAALALGIAADRIAPSRATALCFALLMLGYALFAFVAPAPSRAWLLYANVLFCGVAMFGLRGVYFALLQEGAVPPELTGTAVGVISVIGFTPDVFIAPLMGVLLDGAPGALGHQRFFTFLFGTACAGLMAALLLMRVRRAPAPGGSTAR